MKKILKEFDNFSLLKYDTNEFTTYSRGENRFSFSRNNIRNNNKHSLGASTNEDQDNKKIMMIYMLFRKKII